MNDKMQFTKTICPKSIKVIILISAIFCYISAGVTLMAALINPFSVFDAAIVLALGLLIHILKSRIAACFLLAYALFNLIVSLLLLGQIGGWLIIAAAVLAVMGTFQFHIQFAQYQREKTLQGPNTEV